MNCNLYCTCLKFITAILFLVIAAGNSFAQYASNTGNFQVDEQLGCAPLTINITSTVAACPCDATCPCDVFPDINNGPNTFAQNDLDITYPNPGTYNLVVQLQNEPKDTIQIIVLEDIAPEFVARSCESLAVAVEITDTNYDQYEVDYNDGSTIVVNRNDVVPNYTYATAGMKTVAVRGINNNARDNCSPASQSVLATGVVNDASLSALRLNSNIEVEIDYIAPSTAEYHLQIAINNNTNFQRYLTQTVDISQSSITINDSNLDFDNNYYCFRIATYNPCSNSYTGFSNAICSINLNEIGILNNQMDVTWPTSSSGVSGFEITRNGTSLLSNVQVQFYNDIFNIDCNTEYCYTITADYGSGITSTSLEKCGTSISTDVPTTIENINATVISSNEVSLSWPAPVNFVATAYRIYKDNSTTPDTTVVESFTDSDITSTAMSSCYVIDYVDGCGNEALASNEVCSIALSYQLNNGEIELDWNNYTGWASGVSEYAVMVVNQLGGAEVTSFNSAGTNTSFTVPVSLATSQSGQYTIIARSQDTSMDSVVSNAVNIVNSANIKFPNAFTPEGTNNTFKAVGRYISAIDLKIYSRWGELMAHITDNDSGWNGTYNGRKSPEGTYIYVAQITDEAGNVHERNGTILLIRK